MKTTGPSRRAAFSLVELIVTIGVIGIIAAVAIPMFGNVMDNTRRTIARDHLEALNRGVANFSHACWKIPTTPVANDSADELAVVRTLQWKFPANSNAPAEIKLGSPYFDPKYGPIGSSDKSTFRIRWNGKGFELIEKGQSGTGLLFDAEKDFRSNPYSFPTGYKPEGSL